MILGMMIRNLSHFKSIYIFSFVVTMRVDGEGVSGGVRDVSMVCIYQKRCRFSKGIAKEVIRERKILVLRI